MRIISFILSIVALLTIVLGIFYFEESHLIILGCSLISVSMGLLAYSGKMKCG